MEQEIDIKIAAAIDAVDASKTLGELRKSIKDLKSLALEAEEGSKAFDTLTTKIGQTEDRLKDLNEVVAMKTGSDVENLAKSFAKFGSYGATSLQAVTGAMGLFGDQSEETMKQLVKLQSAFNFANGIKALVEGFDEIKKSFSILMTTMKSMMASNPFGLILIAITAVIGALFLLRNHIKPIGQMFDAIGAVIKKIIQAVKDFTDAIGLTNFAVKDSVEKNIKQFKKEQDALEKSLDEQIKVRKAQGKKSVDLDSALLLSKIKHTEDVIKQYDRIIDAGENLNKEQQKLYDEAIIAAQNYTTELLVIYETSNKEQQDLIINTQIETIRLQMELNGNGIENMKTNANLEKEILRIRYEEQRKQMETNYYTQLDNLNKLYKQNKKTLDDILQYQKEYGISVNEVAKNYNTKLEIIDKKSSTEIINERKSRAEKIKKIEQDTYKTNLDNLKYNADKSEKLYNDEYNKIKEFLQKGYQAYLSNGEEINDNDISIILARNLRLEAFYNDAKIKLTEYYDNVKLGYESEIEQLEQQNSKIKDKNSKQYKYNESQIKKFQNTIEQLTIDHNERIENLNINNDKILIDAKNESYDEQIRIEEEGLNRTDVIYNLKLQKLETNLKYEQDALKKSYDEGEILAIRYYTESQVLLEKFNLDKIKLDYETNKKIEEGRELSNDLQIKSQAKQWNKLNNSLKAFLNVDQKEYDAALLNNLNELEKQKNNELKVLEDYYNTQRELHKGNVDELKKIDEQYAKDKAQIDADYEKKKQDETEAAYQAYMQQVSNNLGQYFSALSSLFSNITSLVDQISEQQIDAAEEVMNKQIEAIDATANAQIAAAERDITDTVVLEETKQLITKKAIDQTLAAKNKYAKEENKLKSKQFKMEKASNIVKATMDGIMAVMQALASAPPPYNAILAAISGAAAAVNIGMLASTKPPKELEGADVSGGSFTSPYTGGSGSSSSSSPNVNAAAFYKLGQGGPNILSQQNGGMDNKVYVVESDIRQTSGRVETIERRAGKSL